LCYGDTYELVATPISFESFFSEAIKFLTFIGKYQVTDLGVTR